MAPKQTEVVKIGDLLPIKIDPKIIVFAAILIILGTWLALGGPVYTVGAGEVGVVLTFGEYTTTTQPGLRFKLPWPVQTVEKVNVAKLNPLEFGFRTAGQAGRAMDFSMSEAMLHEAQMLTGDENIVNCSMEIQYRIQEPLKFLFNYRSIAEAERALRHIGEASLRQAVGDRPIDFALTTGKAEIVNEVKRKMEELIDLYGLGVAIPLVQLLDVKPPREVESAFREVATAKEEREQIINVAEGYRLAGIPKAEGEAQRVILNALGYKEARIAEAKGDVARFVALAKEYAAAPEITRARMHLEAMADLLPRMRLTIIDENAGIINLKTLGGGAAAIVGQSQAARGGQR